MKLKSILSQAGYLCVPHENVIGKNVLSIIVIDETSQHALCTILETQLEALRRDQYKELLSQCKSALSYKQNCSEWQIIFPLCHWE